MSKRQRSSNFSDEGSLKLIELCGKYKNVINNKKTDAVTWKDKVFITFYLLVTVLKYVLSGKMLDENYKGI